MPVDGYVRDRQDFDLDPAPVRIEMERVERARLPPVQNRGFGMYRSASDLDLSRIASLRQGRLETVPEESRLASAAAAGATQKRDPPAPKRIVIGNDIGPL